MQVSNQLVNTLLNYLAERPYREVFQLIDAIQKEAAAQVPQPEEKPNE
jgi:hypothetical protein